MSRLLEVKGLETRFFTQDGVVHAVNGITYHLDEGETLAIVGESGCGKSVGVMSLLRLIPQPPGRITAGQVLFGTGDDRKDLLKLSDEEIRQVRGGQISMIFQDPMTSLNPVMNIGKQMAEPMILHLGITPKEARERAIKLLESVGIPRAGERLKDYPHQYSGGMRQRVMIAMALSCNPQILIADEPTTALDVTIQAQIVDLVIRLRQELGMAIIWITHDLGVAASIANRIAVMYLGKIVESSPSLELFSNTLHPYSQALLAAVPIPKLNRKRERIILTGGVPSPINPPSGCRFHTRCPWKMDICSREEPPLEDAGSGHFVACHKVK